MSYYTERFLTTSYKLRCLNWSVCLLGVTLFITSCSSHKSPLKAATPCSIGFVALWDGRPVNITQDQNFDDKVAFSMVKFYVGNIRFYSKSSLVYCSPAYHIVDIENPSSCRLEFGDLPSYDKIVLGIGVDSLDNLDVKFEGALDPVNGMYWTWQSGYINVKVEGYHPKSKYRNNEFQYHLGGYISPNATERNISFIAKSKVLP